MKITPRDYQLEAVDALWQYFEEHTGNPLIAMPTGSGKSLIPAVFIERALSLFPQTRFMVLTHVKELISQNFNKLMQVLPNARAGIYSAGLKRKEWHHPITFAGIQSVHKVPHIFAHIDIVFIDEAHLVGERESAMYVKFLDALRAKNPKLKIVGQSASCYRTNMGPLTEGKLFTDVCYDLTNAAGFKRLVDAGHLVRLVARKTAEQLDVSDVGTGADGDFKQNELQAAVDNNGVTQRAVEEFLAAVPDRKRLLLFGAGVDHANHIRDALEFNGVSAVAVHSKMPAEEREANYNAFLEGRVRAAVSMNAMTTGVDVPEIDAIGMLRPTRSAALWVQMLGRGTRPAPWAGKTDCIVLDFAGNTARLGPIDDPVVPLPPRLRKKKQLPRPAPVRACDKCLAYVHASLHSCPECGYEFTQTLNIHAHSDGLTVMALEEPVVETFDVTTVTYAAHQKKGAPISLRVNYMCGLRRFSEFLCPEHGTAFTWSRWVDWWRTRAPPYSAPPETVKEALSFADNLRWPRKLHVWINKQHPEITDHVF